MVFMQKKKKSEKDENKPSSRRPPQNVLENTNPTLSVLAELLLSFSTEYES